MENMPTNSARPTKWVYREVGSGARFINGDVLFARITPCLENGKTAFIDFLEECEIGWGSTEYIVMRSSAELPPEYAYFVARTPELREYAIRNMSGTSGRQRVSASAFSHFLLVIPSIEIANHFGAFARDIFRKMSADDKASRTLAETRDALLPKLISGQVRVGSSYTAS
jgi:type I restriction enzyme S subunit